MTKKFKCPLYEMTFYITFDKELIEKISEEPADQYHGMVAYPEGKEPYLYIDLTKYNIGLVAHEAYHLACEVFEHTGAKLDLSNQEPFAYLLEWIVNTIDKFKKANE